MTLEELKAYLADVVLLESQLENYEKIKESYEENMTFLSDDRSNVRMVEAFANEKTEYPEYNYPFNLERDAKSISFEDYGRKLSPLRTVPKRWNIDTAYEKISQDVDKRYKLLKKTSSFIFWAPIILAIIITIILLFQSLWYLILIPFIPCVVLPFSKFNDWVQDKVKNAKLDKLVKYMNQCHQNEIPQKEAWTDSCLEARSKEYNTEILPTISQTTDLLNKLYSLNIIHPKYREGYIVIKLLEYLDTGRCTKLEGKNGAYNIYEFEHRLDDIIEGINEINFNLKTLNATMQMVALSIQQTNNSLSTISMSLDRIEANTALTAYNSQCIAYNTDITNRYNY